MLEKDNINRMVTEGNRQGSLHKSAAKKKSALESITEEIATA